MQNPTVTDFLRKVNVDEDLMPAYRAVFRKKMPLIAARFFRWASSQSIGPMDLSELHLGAFLVQGRALKVPSVALAVIEKAVRVQASRLQNEGRAALALISPACTAEIDNLISEAFGLRTPDLLLALGAAPPLPIPLPDGARLDRASIMKIASEILAPQPAEPETELRVHLSQTDLEAGEAISKHYRRQRSSQLYRRLLPGWRLIADHLTMPEWQMISPLVALLNDMGIDATAVTDEALAMAVSQKKAAGVLTTDKLEQDFRRTLPWGADLCGLKLPSISSHRTKATPMKAFLAARDQKFRSSFEEFFAAFKDPKSPAARKLRQDDASQIVLAAKAASRPGDHLYDSGTSEEPSITAKQNTLLRVTTAAVEAGHEPKAVLDLAREPLFSAWRNDPRFGSPKFFGEDRYRALLMLRHAARWDRNDDLHGIIQGHIDVENGLPKKGMSDRHFKALLAFTPEHRKQVVRATVRDLIQCRIDGDLHRCRVALAIRFFISQSISRPAASSTGVYRDPSKAAERSFPAVPRE